MAFWAGGGGRGQGGCAGVDRSGREARSTMGDADQSHWSTPVGLLDPALYTLCVMSSTPSC